MNNINPIAYLNSKGFRTTSDPTTYASGVWGLRQLWQNGFHADEYCNGYHRAYDMSKSDGAAIPSIAEGVIANGTRKNGTFGGQVCVVHEQLGIQVTYAHVKTNIPVKVGQKVKQGQTIAYQGNTNNLNDPSMPSHLHIQFQGIGALGEWEFTCLGIDPLNINVNDSAPVDNPPEPKEEAGTHVVKANDTLWGIAQAHNTTVDKVKSDNKLKNDIIHIDQKLKVGKGKVPEKESFNKMTNRKLSNTAHFKGKVDKLGAEVRNKSGNNFNSKSGYDLQPGDTVYIFQVAGNGWGKIYTSRTSGNGSNDWIWLERLNVTQVF